MTTRAITLVIRELSRAESESLLARFWTARLAFCYHDRVDIEPIHYVYDAPWIFGRTGVGQKLLSLAHNQWCALEADDVRGVFEWESVVVHGPFYALNSNLGKHEKYDRAVEALRRLIPQTLTEDDPTPFRTVVFGVHATEIAGRACEKGP